jgi:hypothetical protein
MKSPKVYFAMFKSDSRVYKKRQRLRIAKRMLREEKQLRGLQFPGFKTYNKAGIIKAAQYWQKTRKRLT